MAMKLISRGGAPPDASAQQQAAPQQQQPSPQGGIQPRQQDIPQPQESPSSQGQPGDYARRIDEEQREALKRGAFALGRGIEAPLTALSGLSGLLGGPTVEAPTEKIRKALGYTQEELEPQGFRERVSHRLAEVGPISAAFGGVPGLAQAAAGSVAGGAFEEAGLPPAMADIAQIGTEIGTGAIAGRIPTAAKKIGAYETFARGALGEGERHAAKSLPDVVKSVRGKLGVEVNEKAVNQVNKAVETLENNIQKFGKEEFYSPSKMRDVRKSLHRFYKEAHPTARPLISELTQGINAQFTANIAENPQFFSNLHKSDQLTQMKNMQGMIGGALGTIIEPLQKAGILPPWVNYIQRIVDAPERFVRSIATKPEARRHYFDLTKAAVKEDPGLFVKAATNLQEEVPVVTVPPKGKQEKEKKGSSMKLISRES